MPHDHKADEAKVRAALKPHKGKGVPQVEARLRAFVDASLANIKAADPADLPAMIDNFAASKDAAIALVMNGD